MNRSKPDFIIDLLNNKRLDISTKERLFRLVSVELKDMIINDDVLERLSVIENEIKTLQNQESQPVHTTPAKTQTVFILPNPENTKNFLANFRDGDGLKYLTHDFKDPSNPPERLALLDNAKEEFENAINKYPDIPGGLKRRIEEFAFNKEPKWFIRKGDKRINITEGWSSKEFSDWFDGQEVGNRKHPCKHAKWNKQFIEPFKKSIQIRDGLLYEIIEENIDLVFSKDEKELFDIKFLDNGNDLKLADFYTDVDALGLALFHILTMNKKQGLKNRNFEMTINFIQDFEGSFKCLKICHLNSVPTKILNDDFGGGDSKTIFGLLKGLCNWAIEAEFGKESIRKYFLYDKSVKEKQSILHEKVKGFTHLLIFY